MASTFDLLTKETLSLWAVCHLVETWIPWLPRVGAVSVTLAGTSDLRLGSSEDEQGRACHPNRGRDPSHAT